MTEKIDLVLSEVKEVRKDVRGMREIQRVQGEDIASLKVKAKLFGAVAGAISGVVTTIVAGLGVYWAKIKIGGGDG
jgi:hypothetical protein